MDHVFENIIDILVAVVVMFLFPLLYFGQRQDTITQSVIYADTSNLVDTVCTKGYITKGMYETYLKGIDSIHVLGDVHFEYKEFALEPEYRFKTADEVIAEQNTAFAGTNVYTFVPVSTDIPYVIDLIDNSGLTMNTETNASVIASAANLPANPSHVHTDACYPRATKHIHSAYGGSCYTWYDNRTYHLHTASCYHTHTTNCYSLKDCPGTYTAHPAYTSMRYCNICKKYVTYINMQYYCDTCGADYGDGDYYTCGHNSSGGTRPSCSCTALVNTLICGKDETTPYCGLEGSFTGSSGYTLTCGKTEGDYYNGSTQAYPMCNTIIKSINPTHPTQIVYVNDPLITTILVKFEDGSTKTVTATASFSPNTIVKNKIVTLSYGGFTQNITVTVIPKTKTCVNGHTYNLNADGSDPGCCFCNSWLSTLEVIYPSTNEITIYKGTTLEENGVVLLATYLNGKKETLYSGYVNNLDSNYVGTQTVTLSYKGKYTSLKVITKRNLIQCSKCGRFYELYPDESNPGCPYCTALIPVFTGKVMKHYTSFYKKDILNELMEGSGIHYFKEGDYINLQVANKTKTLGTKLISTFIPNVSKTSIKVEYGGVIRDEVRVK